MENLSILLGDHFTIAEEVVEALKDIPRPSGEAIPRFVRRRVENLGLDGAVTYERICQSAKDLGLRLFSLDSAVNLLLQWHKFDLQLLPPVDLGIIILAMEEPVRRGSALCTFFVEFTGESLDLCFTSANPRVEYLSDQEFLFLSDQ